ncbi:MAG: GNAT family N-acetyltransferase, partial [Lachnospiraceae bacterium]|nr:GNAT family N-acetyltransferase [Lachnospiraceae bacterium]
MAPYRKDLSVYERAADYEKEFDISGWRFYMGFDGEKPIGAMTVAGRTRGLNMLSGRDDACVLWDLRVAEGYKQKGIGQRLFDRGVADAKEAGYRQMIIECQNNNIPAC